jgi:hypothetical protein
MSAPTQQRVVLPESIVDCIKAITADTTLTPAKRLTGVLVLIFGWAWYERQDTVDPTAIALPQEQWEQVCGMMTNAEVNGGQAVDLALAFMNSGPSAYRE